MIDISKIDAGQIELSKENVSVNKLIKEVYSFFYSELMSKNNFNILLKINFPEIEIVAFTDETRLKQILINLVSNAVKFTDKGIIEIGFNLIDNKINFYVQDSGIGISKDKQDLIFERFQQESHSTEKLYGGTGLGLAIVKACVELLGGEIWVESKQGIGSTFYFNIQYIPSAIKAIPKKEEKVIQGDFNNELILIVEDDNMGYQYLFEVLSDLNLRIIRTSTGRKTIEESLSRNDIKLVLMDINMPDLSGIDATLEIRKQKPDLPIIAQTAYAMNGDKQKFIDIGCNEYLSKPINKDDLILLLEKFLA